MKYAVIRLGYDATYAIPVAKLSMLLELLNECIPVASRYFPYLDDTVVYKTKPCAHSIDLTDKIAEAMPVDPKDEENVI